LKLVAVPSLERERLRDLARCREDLRGDLMRALFAHSLVCWRLAGRIEGVAPT
jgi:hypothetical protein